MIDVSPDRAGVVLSSQRERVAGAVVEFLEAKSRSAGASVVGDGFRRLCERWGLNPTDWDAPEGSIARALVEEEYGEKLAHVVSELVVDYYEARGREVAGPSKREVDGESVRLVDWLDRFTPFRVVEAWARRSGPPADWWSAYVAALLEDARELSVDWGDDDGVQKCIATLRRAEAVEMPDGPRHSFAHVGVLRRVMTIAAEAPLGTVAQLAAGLLHAPLVAAMIDSVRLTVPSALAQFLLSSHPRLRAFGSIALERSPGLARPVALEVGRIVESLGEAERTMLVARIVDALRVTFGGVLAKFLAGRTGGVVDREYERATGALWRSLDESMTASANDSGAGPFTAISSLPVEWCFAVASQQVAIVTAALETSGAARAGSTDVARARWQARWQNQWVAMSQGVVRLAVRCGEPTVASVIATAAWPLVSATNAAVAATGSPEGWIADEVRRAGLSTIVAATVARVATPAVETRARAVVVGGVRSRLLDLATLFTGIELLRFLFFVPLWLLGYRRSGTLEIGATELTFAGATRFLGRDVRSYAHVFPATALRAFSVLGAWRIIYLVTGLAAIAVFTLFGVSAVFDGIARQHAGIIAFGAGLVTLGLLIDGSCYLLFLRGGERVYIRATFDGPIRSVKAWVDRADIDAVVRSLTTIVRRRRPGESSGAGG